MAGTSRPLLEQPDEVESAPSTNSAKATEASAEAAATLAENARRQRLLVISFCLMLVIGLGNRVTSIVQYSATQAYPLFINLLTTFWYIPVSLAYIIPMQKYRPDVITPEARAVPQKVWAVMGLLDSIAGVMQALALDKLTNGGLITLLLQSAIPLSMLITWIFLRTKYSRSQFVGAFIVILGLVAALIPTFTGSDSSSDANSSGNPSAAFTLAWSAVLVASCIPMCLSSVYKEKALGDTEIDAIYLNYWVAVYQFVFSFPLLIPSAYASELAIADIPTNLWRGLLCYSIGHNSTDADNCGLAPVYTNLYVLFNIGFNILIILLLKYGSSNILWLCLTIQVPFANLAFAIPWMPKSKPAQWENALGLVLILAGLVTYRFWPLVSARLGCGGGARGSRQGESSGDDAESELIGSDEQ